MVDSEGSQITDWGSHSPPAKSEESTTDTSGGGTVVIKHSDGLLTVYTQLEGLTVAKDASVSQGQVIARVRAGNPSFLHFEVRRGLQSLDPTDFLP